MRINKIVILAFFSFIVADSNASNLKCSKNGTEIIFVNGVNNTKREALDTAVKINETLTPVFNKIDSKEIVSISNVYNESLGTGNDIIEYVIDRARVIGINDPWKYYKVFSVSSAIDGALINKLKSKNKFLPAGFTLSPDLSVRKLALLSGIYNSYFTSTEVLKSSNIKLQAELHESILSKITADKKVILVAHSQGNAVVNAATASLPEEINGMNKVKKYLGAVHVATPVNTRAAVKSRMIKLDTDRVVGFVPLSENANYEYNYLGIKILIPIFAYVALDYLIYNSPDLLGHNMSSIYLGDRKARKIGSSEDHISMSEIFKENVIEVAEELEANCGEIKICNGGFPYDIMTFNMQSVGTFNLGHLLIRNSNGDGIGYRCECKKIQADLGETFSVHVDAVQIPFTESGQVLTPITSYDGIIRATESLLFLDNILYFTAIDDGLVGSQQYFRVIQGAPNGPSCDEYFYK